MTFVKGHTFVRSRESYTNPQTIQKLRAAKIGTKMSQATKDKISAANKGRPHGPMSEEHKRKVSIGRTGKAIGNKNCIGRTPWNKGIPITEQTREKLRKRLRGRPAWNKGKKCPDISARQLGRKNPASAGEKNINWKGGVTPRNEKIRKSVRYRLWRTAVFQRDDYTCQACGAHGGYLHADHELPFAYFPALRFEVLNGRTLCKPCHKNTPTYAAKTCVYL